MSAITLCLRDPALRAAGLVMALQGAIACSFGPYFSTLAVHSFGFGDRGYAVLLVLSSLVSVSASVIGGIRADQTANRRQVTLVAVCSLLLGTVLMTATPGPAIFALTAALLIPISSITFGQVFALARLAARCDLIISSGGLGPTADDLTRRALAVASHDSLVHDSAGEAQVRAWFAARGRSPASRGRRAPRRRPG